MAVFPEASRPASRSCTAASSIRGGVRSSRPVRSLSPALQVIQKSLLPDSPRVPDAPRGSRPREYLSAMQGMRHSAGDWKGPHGAPEISAARQPSPVDASVSAFESVQSTTASAGFRNRRPRTPDVVKSSSNAKRDASFDAEPVLKRRLSVKSGASNMTHKTLKSQKSGLSVNGRRNMLLSRSGTGLSRAGTGQLDGTLSGRVSNFSHHRRMLHSDDDDEDERDDDELSTTCSV